MATKCKGQRPFEESVPPNIASRLEKSRKLAQKRRETYKDLMTNLAEQLPFSKEVISQVDYNSRLRLALCFFRMKTLGGAGERRLALTSSQDDAEISSEDTPAVYTPGLLQNLMLEAMDGFLMVILSDGTIIYLSESIHKHLGLFQSEHMGFSLYDLVLEEDHNNVKDEVSRTVACAHSRMGLKRTSVPCSFFCRMKCSRFKVANTQTKSPGYKLVHVNGHFRIQGTDPFLVVLVKPVTPPSILEIRMEGNMFVTHYGLDMKCIFYDGRLNHLMGYARNDLEGTSVFDFHHHDDIDATVECSKGIQSRGEGLSGYFRMITKHGKFVWLQTRATMMFDSRSGNPSYIVCMNFLINKDTGNKCLAAKKAITATSEVEQKPPISEEGSKSHDPFPIPREDGMEVNPLDDCDVVSSATGVSSLAAAEMKSKVVTPSSAMPPSATPTVFEEPSSTTTPPRSSQHPSQSQYHSNTTSTHPHSTLLSSHSMSTETCVPDSTTSLSPTHSARMEKISSVDSRHDSRLQSLDSGHDSRLQSLDSGHDSRLHSLDSGQVSGLHRLDSGQNSRLHGVDSGHNSRISSVDLGPTNRLHSVTSSRHPSITVFSPLSRYDSSSNSMQATPNPTHLVSARSERTDQPTPVGSARSDPSAGAVRNSSCSSGLSVSPQNRTHVEMQQRQNHPGTVMGNQSQSLGITYTTPPLSSTPISSSASSTPSLSSAACFIAGKNFPEQNPQIPPNPSSLPPAPPSLPPVTPSFSSTPPSLPPAPPSIAPSIPSITHSLPSSSSIIPSLLSSNAFLHDPVSAQFYPVHQDPVITEVHDLADVVPSQMYPVQSVNQSVEQSAYSQGGQFDLYTGQANQPVYSQNFQSGQVFDGRVETQRLQHFEMFAPSDMGQPISSTHSQYPDPYIKHEPGTYPNSCQFTNVPLTTNASVPLHHQMGQQQNQNLGQNYNFGQQHNFQENGSFVNIAGTHSVLGTGYQQSSQFGPAPSVTQFQQPQSGNSMHSAPFTNTVPPPNQTIFGTTTSFGPFGGLQSGQQFAPSQNPAPQSQNMMTSSVIRDATATNAPQPTNQIAGLPLLTREDLRMLEFVEQLDPGTSIRDLPSFS